MAEVTDDNREAKEAYLDSKMEKIRQRNKELQQRYLEIEADKQNAEENSNAALAKQLAQDGTVEKTPRGIARSSPRSNAPKPRKPKPDSPGGGGGGGGGRETREPRETRETSSSNDQSRRQQRLSEDENPPPDPSYNFLFDRLRVGIENDEQRIQSRRHPSNYGGQDFSNVKNTIQIRRRHEREHPRGPPRNKMEMSLTMTGHERTQYEEWKRVQDQCDKERLARQKTASGEWRREWDRDKIIQDDDDNEGWRHETGPRGGRAGNRGCLFGRGGGRDRDPIQDRDRNDRGDRGDRGRDRRDRGRGGNNGGEMPPFPSTGRGRGHNPRRPPPNKRYSDSSSDADMARSPTDRKVNIGRDFLQIRVNNDLTSSPTNQTFADKKPAQQRPRRVGSGRVLSASSQSEDEKVFGEEYSPKSEAIKEDEAKVAVKMEVKMEDLGKETEGSVDESAGGDESWEDLTTSGNESQDLSCPTDDGHDVDPIKDDVFQAEVGKIKAEENGVEEGAGNNDKSDRSAENGETDTEKGSEGGFETARAETDSEVDCKVENGKDVVAEENLEMEEAKSNPKDFKMEENEVEVKMEIPEAESGLESKSDFKMEEKEAKPELEAKPDYKMDENEAKAEVKLEVEAKAEAEVELEAEAEVESEAEAEVESEAEAEVESEAEAEVESEAEAKAELEAEAEAEVELEAKAEAEVELEAKAKAEVELEAKAKAEVELEAKAKAEVELETKAKVKAEVELEAKPEFKMEEKDSELESKAGLETSEIGLKDDCKMEERDSPAVDGSIESKMETLDLNCEMQIAADELITSGETNFKDIKQLE